VWRQRYPIYAEHRTGYCVYHICNSTNVVNSPENVRNMITCHKSSVGREMLPQVLQGQGWVVAWRMGPPFDSSA
jgi:hypothetical protein